MWYTLGVINKLILNNFQQHEDITLNFTKGVNVIWGDTGTGKSSIRRAITNVLYQSPSGDFRRRVNGKKAKQCKIELTTDGYSLQRIRSNTLNRYVLNNDKEFDASGRNIPQEILDLIQLKPLEVKNETYLLNTQDQLSTHFLLIGNGLGTIRANILSQITGDDVLDKLTQDYNKDLLGLSKEEKQLEQSTLTKKDQLDLLNREINILTGTYEALNIRFKAISELKVRLDTLSGLSLKFEAVLCDLKASQKVIVIPNIDNLKEVYNQYKVINELHKNYNSIITRYNSLLLQKNNLKIPEIDLDILNEMCYTLNEIGELDKKWKSTNLTIGNTESLIVNLDNEIKMLNEKKQEIMKKVTICPLTNKICSSLESNI